MARHRKQRGPREERPENPVKEKEAPKEEAPKPKELPAKEVAKKEPAKRPVAKRGPVKKEAVKKPASKWTLVGIAGVAMIMATVALAVLMLMSVGDGPDQKPDQPPIADNGDGNGQPTPEPEPQPTRKVPRTRPGDQPNAPDVIRVARGEERSYLLAGGKWYDIEFPEGSSWTLDRWADVTYRFSDGEAIEAPFGKAVEMPDDWSFELRPVTAARIVIRVF